MKIVLEPIGFVRSPLTERERAPKQGFEGAPDAWLEIEERYRPALSGIREGQELVLITWLDRGERNVLEVHPRDDARQPLTGVFATRSQDRPNPLGLHRVRVREVSGTRLEVGPLEALDGTPLLDVRPVLSSWDDT